MTKQPAFVKAWCGRRINTNRKEQRTTDYVHDTDAAGFLASKVCKASVSDAKSRWIGLSLSRRRTRSTRWGQPVPPHNLLSATAMLAVLLSLAIAPISSLGAAKNASVSPQLAGYKA